MLVSTVCGVISGLDPPSFPVFSPDDFSTAARTIRTALAVCGVALSGCAVGGAIVWLSDDAHDTGKTILLTAACILPIGLVMLVVGALVEGT